MVSFKNIGKSGILFLAMFFATTICLSQTRVTGHVFAEIVETLSAVSNTNDYLHIEQNSIGDQVNLGEISLHGKSNTVVSVLVTTNGMTGNYGDNAGFEVIPCLECSDSEYNNNGIQTYKLQANTDLEPNSNTSLSYSAQYEIVFAHN
jgi:hypothetical protein